MSEGARLPISQRNTGLLIERARVRRDGDRIVYDKAEGLNKKTLSIPFANLAILFLGQGTSLPQNAAQLLAEEGVYVAFVGTGGAPLHYGSLPRCQVTEYMRAMFPISQDQDLSLNAAKAVATRRVELILAMLPELRQSVGVKTRPEEIAPICQQALSVIPRVPTHEKLLSLGSLLSKKLCSAHAASHCAGDFSRRAGDKTINTTGGLINSRIDHGNDIAHGIAGAVLWALGIPPSLSVFHGKTRAGGLVADLADIFKDALILPLAFADHASEVDYRQALMDALHDHNALGICFDFMKSLLQDKGAS